MNKMNVLWFVFSGRMNGKPWIMMKFKGNLRMSWSNQLMNMSRRWSWRNLNMNMNAKVESLSIIYQFQWRNSRIDDKSFHEVSQIQHLSKFRMEAHMKNTISLSTPTEKTFFQFSREEDPYLAWRKHVTSEGILL